MTGINHILTGSIIGAAVAGPVAIPLSFASHFLLDVLPHYGIEDSTKRSDDWVWKLDVALIVGFVLCMVFVGSEVKIWAATGAFAATSPDLAWIYHFGVTQKFGKVAPQPLKSRFNQFHSRIQTRESEARFWIEASAFVVLSGVFVSVLL